MPEGRHEIFTPCYPRVLHLGVFKNPNFKAKQLVFPYTIPSDIFWLELERWRAKKLGYTVCWLLIQPSFSWRLLLVCTILLRLSSICSKFVSMFMMVQFNSGFSKRLHKQLANKTYRLCSPLTSSCSGLVPHGKLRADMTFFIPSVCLLLSANHPGNSSMMFSP